MCAERFGVIRAGLFDSGIPAHDFDLLIATTALVYGFSLVTHNVADYANVPNLNVIDWMIP